MREKAADKEQKIQEYVLRYQLTTRQKVKTHMASSFTWNDTAALGPLGSWNQGAEYEELYGEWS